MVRSTHGVNCTGSCSWKVYVKDGIITWETQQTDYPSVGPDRPEYEPRGCPRGAAFSWYTYSPTRVRYPYVRGVLLRDVPGGEGPAAATRSPPGPTSSATRERRRRTSRPAARAAWCAATWDEAVEIVAAAHVHTIKTLRPGPGRRVLADPGDVDGLARRRRPVHRADRRRRCCRSTTGTPTCRSPRPQVFGDQTDVPESGDWWDAAYLIMWGSNVPVTRTPDAHWMAEARYRGQKVVAVAPDYADNAKFADEWLPAAARHRRRAGDGDGARGPARSSSSTGRSPYFTDYVQALHRPAVPGHAEPSATAAVRARRSSCTAADLGRRAGEERGVRRPCCWTRPPASRSYPTARSASATPSPARAGGTSTSATSSPLLSLAGAATSRRGAAAALRQRATARRGAATRGVPVRRIGGHLVTTVFDLMLAQYGVGRRRPARRLADRLRRRGRAVHPGVAGADHLGAGRRVPCGSPGSSPTTPSGPAAAR